MNKEVMEQRLEQLKEQAMNLQLQLDEVNFLIQGYENTLTQTEQPNEPKLS
jgi:hypothetical protein